MINFLYGKTMENLRKRINLRLVNNAEDFLKYTSKPAYITHKIFSKDYAAIHEIKPVLILSKPIYVGFTVLDLSKQKMYDFHYNFIKKIVDAELLFTDTDSLTYEIKFGGVIVAEYVGLKSKMYFIKKIDGKEYNTAKGLSIATEFDKLKMFYLMKKLLDTK